jgi:hypothetical protein
VRFWKRGDDGHFWPDKHRGFSIRLRELPDFAEAISEALELADAHVAQGGRQPGRHQAQGDRDDGSPETRRRTVNEAIRPSGGREAFDEFANT